jgi:hypothetical protein
VKVKEVDWIKGRHYTLFSFRLPRSFHLDVSSGEHESGKVTIQQDISLTIGMSFVDLMKMDFDVFDESHGSLKMMDKLNEVLKKEIEVE